jgi:trehalose 6-phosphate phosphatase
MARFLFDCLEAIRPRIVSAGRIVLLLDFDGTLAPIVDSPAEAVLPETTRRILSIMVESRRFLLALVSGRRVVDLQHRVRLPDVVYAGNHGLEIRGGGVDFTDPIALEQRPALQVLLSTLSEELKAAPRVEVEDKCLTASIHFRGAPDAQARVVQILKQKIDNNIFMVREGKMVYEILPRSGSSKESAARRIRSVRGADGDLPICAGDDATDEGLFAAADSGITIKIGEPCATIAGYFLHGTDELLAFLVWLCGVTLVENPACGR